jgi:hypothetical protein
VEIGKTMVQGQPALAVQTTPIATNGWMRWSTPVIIATQGSTNRRIVVQVCPGIKGDSISKITKAISAGSKTGVLESLPSKCEALHPVSSSSPKSSEYVNIVWICIILGCSVFSSLLHCLNRQHHLVAKENY